MLHSQRKQLEDYITKLDESCMDLELKCLDSIGSRKQLFEKVLKKKQSEMEEKRRNLMTQCWKSLIKQLQQHP